MIRPGKIYPGTSLSLTATFTDDAGALDDPTTITFKTCDPNGTILSYVYGTDSELTRTSIGLYAAEISPDRAGRWHVRWETTGQVSAYEDTFIVQDSPFVSNTPIWDYA